MMTARNIYIALMLVAGVAFGIAVVMKPALAAGPLPAPMVLLLISLIIDMSVMAMAARNRSAPLTMNARLIGFFGAAALYLVITSAMGAAPVTP